MTKSVLVLGLTLLASAAGAQTRSVFTEDLTWIEVRDGIAAGRTSAIIYAGGTEQNGPHMALVKHNAIARYTAGQIATKLGNALVYPVMPFSPAGDPSGEKSGHARFPGTVSVSTEVFVGVMRQEAVAAIAAGFKNVFLMGDHGGGQNELRLVAEGLDADWKGKGVRVFYVGDVQGRATQQTNEYLSQHNVAPGGHAGVAETSQVMYLEQVAKQDWIRKDKLTVAKGQPEPQTGINGDPSPATAEMGKLFIDYKVGCAVDQIQKLVVAR